jgi:hypothetical protein
MTWGKNLDDYPVTDPRYPKRSAERIDHRTTHRLGRALIAESAVFKIRPLILRRFLNARTVDFAENATPVEST